VLDASLWTRVEACSPLQPPKKKKKYVRFSKLSCFGQRARATDQIKNLLSILAFRQIRTLLAQELHS
jgi:hypothetical protein